MIELVPLKDDDSAFLLLAQRIANGAVAALHAREAYVVHIDNWFDSKWLGWWSWSNRKIKDELAVPPFSPNRVLGQNHFIQNETGTGWSCVGPGTPLHLHQAGRAYLAKPISEHAKSGAFIWYSGKTKTD